MPSLQQVAQRFTSHLRTVQGQPFRGTIFHADEGSLSSSASATERLLLRVPPDTTLVAKDEIFDVFGRRFLIANHGAGQLMDQKLYRTFRLIQLTRQMVWTREDNYIDPLSGESRASGTNNLGSIWVSFEPLGSGDSDGKINVQQQTYLATTGAAVQLNDRLDGRLVRQITDILGVFVVEVQ